MVNVKLETTFTMKPTTRWVFLLYHSKIKKTLGNSPSSITYAAEKYIFKNLIDIYSDSYEKVNIEYDTFRHIVIKVIY